MITIYQTQEEADAIPEPKHVWFDVDKWVVYTGEDIPVNPVYIPEVISARQLQIQLARNGIYQNVIDYISSLPVDNETRIGFNTATDFHRNREDVQQMFAFFQVDIDEFFTNASQIT
jgi:hypothetical protein